MERVLECMAILKSGDNKAAYKAMAELVSISEESDKVYNFFTDFQGMLASKNSYVRNRGLVLLSVNARWDKEDKFSGIIDQYLSHIIDEKPITARQCIKSLPLIAEYKPELTKRIITALEAADLSSYPESMEPLVAKDIAAVLRSLK